MHIRTSDPFFPSLLNSAAFRRNSCASRLPASLVPVAPAACAAPTAPATPTAALQEGARLFALSSGAANPHLAFSFDALGYTAVMQLQVGFMVGRHACFRAVAGMHAPVGLQGQQACMLQAGFMVGRCACSSWASRSADMHASGLWQACMLRLGFEVSRHACSRRASWSADMHAPVGLHGRQTCMLHGCGRHACSSWASRSAGMHAPGGLHGRQTCMLQLGFTVGRHAFAELALLRFITISCTSVRPCCPTVLLPQHSQDLNTPLST